MHDGRQAVFLSIRPRFAELILSGVKTVELRRVRPRVSAGALVLLYASSPVRELVGVCTIAGVDVGSVSELWKRHGPMSGLQRAEFNSYFEGATRSVAIRVRDARRVVEPRTLEELRTRLPGFTPPQSYSYLGHDEVTRLEVITKDRPLDSRAGESSPSASIAETVRLR